MKARIALVLWIAAAALLTGCEGYISDGYGSAGFGIGSDYGYYISNVYTEGVDNTGDIYVDVQGQFCPDGNSVGVECDGETIPTTVVSETDTDIEIAMPEASYDNCDFTVLTADQVEMSASSPISPMDVLSPAIYHGA